MRSSRGWRSRRGAWASPAGSRAVSPPPWHARPRISPRSSGSSVSPPSRSRPVSPGPLPRSRSRRRRRGWRRRRSASSRTERRGGRGVALFRCVYHVVDSVRDRLVGKIEPAAFGWHHAGLALKALERVLVEHCQALSEARCPRSFVTKLRCAGSSGGVTSDTSRAVNLLTGEHGRRGRRGRGRPSRITRTEGGVVLARDCDFRWRGDAFGDQSLVLHVVLDRFGTSAVRQVHGKKEGR